MSKWLTHPTFLRQYYRPAKGPLTSKVDTALTHEVISLRTHNFRQSLCNERSHTTIALINGKLAGYATWTSPIQHPDLSRTLSLIESIIGKLYTFRQWILSKLPRWLYNFIYVRILGEEYRKRWSKAGHNNSIFFASHISPKAKEEGYWFLNYLFVNPKYQRKGIGAALLKDGLVNKVDKSGLEAYTAASLVGKGLYARFGFESLVEKTEGDERSGPVVTEIMRYRPGSGTL